MMHGYGFGWADMMSSSSSLFNGTGWMVIPMMGISLLLIVGLVAWFVYAQRDSLGLSRPRVDDRQSVTDGAMWFPPLSPSPSGAVERVARRRYASGEIGAAEYKATMATLR
jgi:uncharacterized membrane protein